MKLPRDLSGRDLARRLESFGYVVTRQTGSHLRLTTQQGGEHHVTIPDHDALRVGITCAWPSCRTQAEVVRALGEGVYPCGSMMGAG